jgi:ABC-type branched-subunit amino acid transport system ATPase component
MPRPSFASSDTAYYFVVLAFVIATAVVIAAIGAGRLGRMLRGLGEAPVAVSTLGLNLNVTRVLVFCVSSFFAALSGILYGGLVHFASTGDQHYASITSLILVATLALLPMRDPWYAVIGGVTTVIPAYIPGADTIYWMNLIFGVSAVLIAMQGGPQTMPERVKALLSRGRKAATAPAEWRDTSPRSRAATATGLEVSGLTVRYGGLVAVHDLNLQAPVGRITGLIGPNGAGKTTTFNACSGIDRPSSGQVKLNGRDVSALRPDQRARLGLGRTFQLPELGDSLSVFENVALGWESGRAGANALRQVVASPADKRDLEAATWEALELCGIAHLADAQAGIVTTGQRRLIELARALCGDFDVLLLDEPSAGLDRDETAAFGDLLARVVQVRGCGILLVEHDMSLVMRICEHIYVLDYGEEIFAGSPAEVASSVAVQTAYLGVTPDNVPGASGTDGVVRVSEEMTK